VPVHDGSEVGEATAQRTVGDVGAPDLLGPVHFKILQQVGNLRWPASGMLVFGLRAMASRPISLISRRTRLRLMLQPRARSSRSSLRWP
jgi:hypothetical protein